MADNDTNSDFESDEEGIEENIAEILNSANRHDSPGHVSMEMENEHASLAKTFTPGPLGNKFMEIKDIVNNLSGPYVALDEVPAGRKDGYYYLINNQENNARRSNGQRSEFWDDCGSWSNGTSPTFSFLERDGKLITIHKVNGIYCIEKMKNRKKVYKPLEPQPVAEELLIIKRLYNTLTVSKKGPDQFRRRCTWVINSPESMPRLSLDVALVEYIGTFTGRKPHGSSKSETAAVYIRTKPAVQRQLKEQLKEKLEEQSMISSWMLCFICCKTLKVTDKTTKYKRPSQLSHKLQNRKFDIDSSKLNIRIIDALEDICDGQVTVENSLRHHSSQYMCHECHVCLRQGVNRKHDVEQSIQALHDRIDHITNMDRRKYYRENYFSDKLGRCWACFHEFSQKDVRRQHPSRLNLTTDLVEGMSIQDCIESLLDDEAESLVGLYPKKTYICRPCANTMRHVVRAQCQFETYHTTFTSYTNDRSPFARLQRGEIIYPAVNEKEIVNTEELQICIDPLERKICTAGTDKSQDLTESDITVESDIAMFSDADHPERSVSGMKRISEGRQKTVDIRLGNILPVVEYENMAKRKHRGDSGNEEGLSAKKHLKEELTLHSYETNNETEDFDGRASEQIEGTGTNYGNEIATHMMEIADEEMVRQKDAGGYFEIEGIEVTEEVAVSVMGVADQRTFQTDTYSHVTSNNSHELEKPDLNVAKDMESETGDAGATDLETNGKLKKVLVSKRGIVDKDDIMDIDLDKKQTRQILRQNRQGIVYKKGAEQACFEEENNPVSGADSNKGNRTNKGMTGADDLKDDNDEVKGTPNRKQEMPSLGRLTRSSSKTYQIIKVNLQDNEVSTIRKTRGQSETVNVTQNMESKNIEMSSSKLLTPLNRELPDEEWVLYTDRSQPEKAEMIRLLFEEAGVRYRECKEGNNLHRQLSHDGNTVPHFDLPILKKGELLLSQTPVICRYLAKMFSLYPEDKTDRLQAEQINTTCHEYITEASKALHKSTFYPRSAERIEYDVNQFTAGRGAFYLSHFEDILKSKTKGKSYLFGEKISYADLAMFNAIRTIETLFPIMYANKQFTTMKAYKARVEQRQNISAYLISNRYTQCQSCDVAS